MPCALAAAPQDGQATFRAAVELVRVDTQVTDRDGVPIDGLLPSDFEVTVSNQPRRVVSADLIHYGSTNSGPAIATSSASDVPAGARVFVLAVDVDSFDTGELRPALQAAERFVQHLGPNDLVGVYPFPNAPRTLNFSHDHLAISGQLSRLVGMREPDQSRYNLSVSEVIDITAGDQQAIAHVCARELVADSLEQASCPQLVRAEASLLAAYMDAKAAASLSGMEQLFLALQTLSGRKTVVLLSAGLPSADRTGGRPDIDSLLHHAGEDVADANTTLYVLHFDSAWRDQASPAATLLTDPGDRFASLGRDAIAQTHGLELLTGSAGGAMFRISAGTADSALGRVLRESTAYYLLGIEPTNADRDGKHHTIRVKVHARGAEVRNRTEVVIPKHG